MIDAVANGAQQMVTEGAANFGAWVPAISVVEAPYIWRDAAHLDKAMNGPIGESFNDTLVKARGMRILGTTYYGTRHITTTSKEVRGPADMVGFKLRVPENDVFKAMAEAWGAKPTPMNFGDAPDRLPHLTTNPHELALSVVFESGLQHFVSTPAMIDAQPDYVKEFLTAVPTVWDETRFVDGYPGQLAVLARRRGSDWYVGAITSDTMVSVTEVPLRFLGAGTYDVSLISDGEDVDKFAYATETLMRRDTMTVELAPRGGFVARFTRRGPEPTTPTPSRATRPSVRPARPAPRPTTRPRRAP
jgi:hypothetical protein